MGSKGFSRTSGSEDRSGLFAALEFGFYDKASVILGAIKKRFPLCLR
jgi:hypothetical protein